MVSNQYSAVPLSLLVPLLPVTSVLSQIHYEEPGEFDVTVYPTSSFTPTPAPSKSSALQPDSDGSNSAIIDTSMAPTMAPSVLEQPRDVSSSSVRNTTAIGVSTALGVGGMIAIVTAVVLQRRRIQKGLAIPQTFSDVSVEV